MKPSLLAAILLTGFAIVGCVPADMPVPAEPSRPAATGAAAASTSSATETAQPSQEVPGVTRESWGSSDGEPVYLYTLTNKNGMVVKITNWGATVTELRVPDKGGKIEDVVLGWPALEGYLKGNGKQANPAYFGGIIGRYCNRIGGASFKIDGKEYPLAKNSGENHLHGGIKGFDKLVWQSEPVKADDGSGVQFTLKSRDGDEKYPGNVNATVTYVLTNGNALRVEMTAATDKSTPVSLTNHTYFNLAGESGGTILDHELELKADKYTAFGDGGVPTGELKSVEGSPLDFRKSTRIGERIEKLTNEPQGYDHNYVLRDKKSDKPEHVATIVEPKSGRTLDVDTTEVGVQFYTGNYLDGELIGKRGTKYVKYAGLCLEPQFFPDSPNKPNFPSPILKPGEIYRHITVYRFGVKK